MLCVELLEILVQLKTHKIAVFFSSALKDFPFKRETRNIKSTEEKGKDDNSENLAYPTITYTNPTPPVL